MSAICHLDARMQHSDIGFLLCDMFLFLFGVISMRVLIQLSDGEAMKEKK